MYCVNLYMGFIYKYVFANPVQACKMSSVENTVDIFCHAKSEIEYLSLVWEGGGGCKYMWSLKKPTSLHVYYHQQS